MEIAKVICTSVESVVGMLVLGWCVTVLMTELIRLFGRR